MAVLCSPFSQRRPRRKGLCGGPVTIATTIGTLILSRRALTLAARLLVGARRLDFCRKYDATDFDVIKDFAKYPELRWLNRCALLPPVLLAVGLWLAFGWVGLVWGFFVSTVVLWHGTFTVNSLVHVWGSRRYLDARHQP